ncbi:MAG: hypothetical protein HQL31_12810, partial [Planctomycetes bacterium]|nr:hypothetical protein [Planctomycetota bacterium]
MKPVLLPTDALMGVFLISLAVFLWWATGREEYRYVGACVRRNRLALLSALVTVLYLGVAVLDCVHFRLAQQGNDGATLRDAQGERVYGELRSLLDTLVLSCYSGIGEAGGRVVPNLEEGYSSPLASESFEKEIKVQPESGAVVLRSRALERPGAHLLGTDKAGGDIFYYILKGTRAAIVIGLATTLIAVPFGILFGVLAGYFGGWMDDVVQYLYTTLSSIPDILLIASLAMIIDA